MKITEILCEGDFSKPTYAYHATKFNNFRSIIKNGLIPNKISGGGYGSTEKAPAGYDLTPLSGVYLTRVAKNAAHIADSLNDKAIIVVCKIQDKAAELDEDRLNSSVIEEKILIQIIRTHIKAADFSDKEQKILANTYTNRIIERNLRDLDNRAKDNVRDSIHQYITSLIRFYVTKDNQDEVKSNQDNLTRKLKQLNHDKETYHTFKLNEPISYSGANKIVGFYNKDSRIGWGDLGAFEGYEYHKVKTPMELLYRPE